MINRFSNNQNNQQNSTPSGLFSSLKSSSNPNSTVFGNNLFSNPSQQPQQAPTGGLFSTLRSNDSQQTKNTTQSLFSSITTKPSDSISSNSTSPFSFAPTTTDNNNFFKLGEQSSNQNERQSLFSDLGMNQTSIFGQNTNSTNNLFQQQQPSNNNTIFTKTSSEPQQSIFSNFSNDASQSNVSNSNASNSIFSLDKINSAAKNEPTFSNQQNNNISIFGSKANSIQNSNSQSIFGASNTSRNPLSASVSTVEQPTNLFTINSNYFTILKYFVIFIYRSKGPTG